MNVLIAFDTIFEQCSVAALSLQNGQILYQKTVAGGRGQTEIILPMLDEALKILNTPISYVKAWAFNRGPGAFSGIRINTAVVQALSVANGAPCIGVSSLWSLADTAYRQNQSAFTDKKTLASVMDARQNQLFFAEFVVQDGQVLINQQPELLIDYDKPLPKTDLLISDGTYQADGFLPGFVVKPSASDIAKLAYCLYQQGKTTPAQDALPVYVRNNAWKTLAEQGK